MLGLAFADDSAAAEPDKLKAALEKLKLPGIKINIEEWCVDIESEVCLEEGFLELIACTPDSKEHESIVVVNAAPMHIHTALLLLGAEPGNPAMRKPLNEEQTRWADIPPRGAPIAVSLVFEDPKSGKETERPISEFVTRAKDEFEAAADPGEDADKFPDTFLFAGSILHGNDSGPRQYIANQSGHVATIATFGDGLLCLPGIHSNGADHLMWQVNSQSSLPAIGAKVMLRLRPVKE